MEYWGFVSSMDIDQNARKIENVKSRYLPAYLAADQRNYMVSNSGESISASSLWNWLTSPFTSDVDLGTGLLHIDDNAIKALQISPENNKILAEYSNKIKVNRVSKEIIMSRSGTDLSDDGQGIEAYRYKLKYWLEKYATPIDFYIALHLATGAPEFVLQMATKPGGEEAIKNNNGEPKIDIGVKVLMPHQDYEVELVYLDIDPATGKVRTEEVEDVRTGRKYTMPVTLTMAEVKAKLAAGETVPGLTGNGQKDAILEKASKFNADNFVVFTPYIERVINHWYYKEVVYQGISTTGKNIDVYQVEELPKDAEGRVRYQKYVTIQVPGYTAPEATNNPGDEETSGNSSGENSGTSTNSGNSNGVSGNPNINAGANEVSTGDDRKELAEMTQKVENAGMSSGGFFNSLLDFMRSANAFIGSFAGITGMIFDMPSQILNSSYASLGSLFNSVMPSNLISGISDGWLRNMAYYANGMLLNVTNMGQYLNFGQIANTLGFGKLQSILSPSNLMNSLGLEKVTSTLMNLSNLTDINQLPYLAASALDVPQLTGAFTGVSNMIQNGVTANSLVDTMYSGVAPYVQGEVAGQVLSTARQAFYAVDGGSAPLIAAGLIGGVATDLVDRTTGAFFDNLQTEISNQIGGQYNVQIEQLLINENARQATGLNINELEGLASVSNLDTDNIKEANKDIEKIQESVEETTEAARELSDEVNKIAQEYAGIDAVTFYYVAKTTREILTELDNASIQLDNFENLFNQYNVQGFAKTQIEGSINGTDAYIGAREAISNARTLIQNLDFSKKIKTNGTEIAIVRNYGKILVTLGTQIYDIINQNRQTIDGGYILLAQAEYTRDILVKAGEMEQKIDVNTYNNVKAYHPNLQLEEFLAMADQLAMIDPTLNGYIDEIGKMDNELKDINIENSEQLANKANQYDSNIDSISWLSNSKKDRLKAITNTLRSRVNALASNVINSNLALIYRISDATIGMTTRKINTLANQILNLPRTTIMNLLSTVRQIPSELIRQVSAEFSQKVAEAITTKTKEALTQKVQEGLTEALGENAQGGGQLTEAVQNTDGGRERKEASKTSTDAEDQQLVDSKDEILTGFYIKETRKRDYMQKSEPLLVPYSFNHWKKLFIDNKYLLAGDYGLGYHIERQKKMDSYFKERIFANQTYINQYGTSIWTGVNGNLEETIYAQLQSMDSVDSQYLLRYFKELFGIYGEELRKAANDETIAANDTAKYTIGWIFRTEKVTEIINTNTGEARIVDKSEYEPVAWTKSNSGTLRSAKTDPVYGFKKDIDIVAPTTAIVVSKTERSVNEFNEQVLPTITLQIQSSDENINGMRVILRGGDYSQATVGATVTKDTVIGKTTDDDILILVLAKGSHAQVSDVSQYVYPPYVTVNN